MHCFNALFPSPYRFTAQRKHAPTLVVNRALKTNEHLEFILECLNLNEKETQLGGFT